LFSDYTYNKRREIIENIIKKTHEPQHEIRNKNKTSHVPYDKNPQYSTINYY